MNSFVSRTFSSSRRYSFARFEIHVPAYEILDLGNPQIPNVKIVDIGYVNTPKWSMYLILSNCSFIVSVKPLKCSFGVRIEIVVSTQSTTKSTYNFQKSVFFNFHLFIFLFFYVPGVNVVVDYADRDTWILRISSQNTKKFTNYFSMFIRGPGRLFFIKKGAIILWHCPFKQKSGDKSL